MRIYYDNIIYSLQKSGGISVVWTNLIKRILSQESDMHFLEYDNARHNICRKELSLPAQLIRNKKSQLLSIERFRNPQIPDSTPFIFHSSYFRTCSNPFAINITTVHDFIYSFYCKNKVSKYIHCKQMYSAIRSSDAIVCISENTKKDLLRLLPDVKASKVHVIYNGVSPSFSLTQDVIPQDYILYVGNRKGYKNFSKIIAAVAASGYELRIVGSPLSPKEEQLLQEKSCRYKQETYVSDHDLNSLYNHAFCLLYPSEYEGFGLPVIEAQKAGCPVIAYNGSCISEIIGDTRLLMNHVCTAEIMSLINKLKDTNFRETIIQAGLQNSNRFSWEKTAELYRQLYYQLWENIKR